LSFGGEGRGSIRFFQIFPEKMLLAGEITGFYRGRAVRPRGMGDRLTQSFFFNIGIIKLRYILIIATAEEVYISKLLLRLLL
jgi:hypothetical protein